MESSTHASVLEFSGTLSKKGASSFTLGHVASERAGEQASNRLGVIRLTWVRKHFVVIFLLRAIFHNAKSVTNGATY